MHVLLAVEEMNLRVGGDGAPREVFSFDICSFDLSQHQVLFEYVRNKYLPIILVPFDLVWAMIF